MKVSDPFVRRLAALEQIARCAWSIIALDYLPARGPLRTTLVMALEDLKRLEGGSIAPAVTNADRVERQRLRRRIARWAARMESLPSSDRDAILGRILARYFPPRKR